MISVATPTRPSRRFIALLGISTLAVVAALAFAGRAVAAETLYWDNYGEQTIGSASIDGTGGGLLNLGAEAIDEPEGMAYDSVTNRLFVASEVGVEGSNGGILAINLDGTGASQFTAPGVVFDEPQGVAVDPATRMIYWINTVGESIGWAKLDGSEGGTLNTSGATVDEPCCRLAIDPAAGRVYWVNEGTSPDSIAYANSNNTGGGGELNLEGSTVEPGEEGLAVDTVDGRLYFTGGGEFGYANLNGSGGGDVAIGSAVVDGSWGIAVDPTLNRLYWPNEENSGAEAAIEAFGFADLGAGTGANLSIATTKVDRPQDPVIIKSPSGTGAPGVTRDASNPAALICASGSWAPDYPGSFVYEAPRSYAYQWSNNGAPISGATSNSYTAATAGTYTCAVTATNQTGSAAQTSAGVAVSAAKLKLRTAKKAKAKAGKSATFKVTALNQGQLSSAKAKLCVTVPKKGKKSLKAPKCKPVAAIAAGAKRKATLKLKVAKDAMPGTYKVTIAAKGAPANKVKAKVVVKG